MTPTTARMVNSRRMNVIAPMKICSAMSVTLASPAGYATTTR